MIVCPSLVNRQAGFAAGRPAPVPAPQAAFTPPAPVGPKLEPPAPHASRRLDSNPLFVDGAGYEELQLSPRNVDFAAQQFGLDAQFVDLVKAGGDVPRYSVVYHNDNGDMRVDAYRAAATAGKNSVFAAYVIKDPKFDPGKAYKNELSTSLAPDKAFGTLLVSKRLAVPASADPATRKFLADSGYVQKESLLFSSFGYSQKFKDYFGLQDGLEIQMFDPSKKSFVEKFKIFYELFKASPEYRTYKMGISLNYIGTAMTLGVITPKLWGEGTAYGVAATISSIDNIGQPALNVVGESLLGGVVDKAVNSDHPLDNLKKIKFWTGTVSAARVGCFFALHPAINTLLGPRPSTEFIGLYAGQALGGAITGVVNGKADIAIHDQLINKANLPQGDFSKNYYQIMGVENSMDQAFYLGTYTGTVAAAAAWPHAALAVCASGAALWAASNFLWPLFHDKPEVNATIEGTAYVHHGDRYVFDSGWEVGFKGDKGRIVQQDENHYSIAVQDGDLYMKNDASKGVNLSHKRRLIDYLPRFLKPRWLGEKEHWDLDNGGNDISISRYGSTGYHLNKLSDNEFLITRQ